MIRKRKICVPRAQISCFMSLMDINCGMKSSEEKKPGLSQSFVTGVIAMVFLVVGYQTALFIHRASVLKIVADRDEPDTVYVYAETPYDEDGQAPENGGGSEPAAVLKRRNSAHSVEASAVRSRIPFRRTESFPFDPNTVSVEDLCRLGFSLRQAQSIDNYRKKGGRFRRKEDFARSYVVSDTIYRRLEPYIDIPLIDLNLADSAAFDSLPGIGGWFAVRMIEHRKALGGYSYKEQLMDIRNFDEDKFNGLKDLVTVSDSGRKPYPLWRLPADSLRKHPYVADYETARAIVLYRKNNPVEKWTIKGLSAAGILSDEAAVKFSGCLLE